ncbi:MAG: flagellar biosynthesis protein FliA [Firmicutes bacterium]|nr:flagellar biosynthesis protein FliA [Bacillota bacterium]
MPVGLLEITIASVINGILLLASFIASYAFPQSLGTEEELHYLEQAQLGDERALSILVERNLRLVAEAEKSHKHLHLDNEELIYTGTIGLIKAIKTYNKDVDISFSEYTSAIIEKELLKLKKAQ